MVIAAAMRHLPLRHREVLVLVHVVQLWVAEIAPDQLQAIAAISWPDVQTSGPASMLPLPVAARTPGGA
jgi:hypothetical protein